MMNLECYKIIEPGIQFWENRALFLLITFNKYSVVDYLKVFCIQAGKINSNVEYY